MRKYFLWIFPFVFSLASCYTMHMNVVNNIDEREANEIVVFLASRGIKATKTLMKSTAAVGDSGPAMYGIAVAEKEMTAAMAVLNKNGFPRKKGITLLELFAKQSLMTTEKEESIRYQSGLEEEMANTICKMDGVLDACVKLSFPPDTTNFGTAVSPAASRVTAAVLVKHQGIVDDPNSHMVSKIKRLVAGGIHGLDVDDVTVISDRSIFTDVALNALGDVEVSGKQPQEYATIWSIIVSKQSLVRFRVLFFSLIVFNMVFLVLLVWLVWKIYPILKREGGIAWFLDSTPLEKNDQTTENE
jgi:type III secretion protein J